ncbi:response regulator [Pseudomonas sp. NPDC007930]|uniref:response regulator transcription factor n=1 Tax=Pseudomonas sp. NPDC007930 TaxID=3364417 RepID=UPI0036E2EA93
MRVVCVIDDDPAVRKAVANLLRSAGYQPACFATGEAFLASSERAQAGCALLDARLPGLQGPDVQRMLSQGPNPPPVICLSAHANAEDIAQALAAGARAFLAKPFDAEALLAAVAQHLRGAP